MPHTPFIRLSSYPVSKLCRQKLHSAYIPRLWYHTQWTRIPRIKKPLKYSIRNMHWIQCGHKTLSHCQLQMHKDCTMLSVSTLNQSSSAVLNSPPSDRVPSHELRWWRAGLWGWQLMIGRGWQRCVLHYHWAFIHRATRRRFHSALRGWQHMLWSRLSSANVADIQVRW